MLNYLSKVFFLILTLSLFASCANYNLYQSEASKNLTSQKPDSKLKLTHSVFLIGDAGGATANSANSVVKTLKKHLNQASENSSVLFLMEKIN